MCHVLIIEDEWIIAEYLRDLMDGAGASTATIASTEVEAIEAARLLTPAIILSDVKLSAGTGPHAVQVILTEAGHIPTIFVTGTPEGCSPCDHAVAILSKPVVEGDVVATFRKFAPV